MVDQKWFVEARKCELIQLKEEAKAKAVPLAVSVQIGDQQNKLHVSVCYSQITADLAELWSHDLKKNS